ncbi:MAG: hypothetical protein HY934_06080 [Candidatus Firestonebacteria bacterium]|nr:hypothetical protein [Candidatus Firestonebacteria bacterium]
MKDFKKYTIFPEIKKGNRYYYAGTTYRVKVDPSNSGTTRGSGRSKVVTKKIYLGTAHDILTKLFDLKKSLQKVHSKEFGLPMAILKVAQEINLTDIIDKILLLDMLLYDGTNSFTYYQDHTRNSFGLEAESGEVIGVYKDKYKVEDSFRTIKDHRIISLHPIWHWTDRKIRIDAFISVLAYLFDKIVTIQSKRSGIGNERFILNHSIKRDTRNIINLS